jgi:Xaa-Pro aminopeptidase
VTTPIPCEEFAARRARALKAADQAGLAGLLVCARGGGALDRYGDIAYLANFYTPFPYIPDLPGRWTARAHTFLALPVQRDPRLVIDVPDDGHIALPASQIVYTDFVLESTITALRETGLEAGRIGFVGADVMPADVYIRLREAYPRLEFVDARDILARLRRVKSPAEITRLRAASLLGSRMIDAMMDAAVDGATHADVVAAGMQVLIPARGMLYSCFMASGLGGGAPVLNKTNFPTWSSTAPLKNGQWFRIGISGVLDGYFFDLSRSKAIGAVGVEDIGLFEAAIEIVETGIAHIRPGATAGDVAEAGLGRQVAMGFPVKGVFSGLGHGIGLGWDGPWLVPNDTTVLEPGMVMSVERTITRDGYLGDFEETVLVTGQGTERLTNARTRNW